MDLYPVTFALKFFLEDFGFEHRLWVYSGRRGIHCWIVDESVRKLSSQARSSVSEYLTCVKGGENCAKKVNLGMNMHPSLRYFFDILPF